MHQISSSTYGFKHIYGIKSGLAAMSKKAISFNRQIVVESPLTRIEYWDRTYVL
jgi:hypothetical protein